MTGRPCRPYPLAIWQDGRYCHMAISTGLGWLSVRYPGRCPGLSHFAPLGLLEDPASDYKPFARRPWPHNESRRAKKRGPEERLILGLPDMQSSSHPVIQSSLRWLCFSVSVMEAPLAGHGDPAYNLTMATSSSMVSAPLPGTVGRRLSRRRRQAARLCHRQGCHVRPPRK